MTNLSFSLHPSQAEIFNSKARFKVVSAGRRFGKSYLSAIMLLLKGLEELSPISGKPLSEKRVFYVAPTFDQGKRIIWDLLKHLGHEVIKSTLENQAVITLINDRKIEIKGSDRPDTLRGVGLSYVVLDEYAFMKPDVWEQILRPTLTDVEGEALFIGTPAGKNHFYDLYLGAISEKKEWEEWRGFTYSSLQNVTLNPKEVDAAKRTMSAANFRQEYEASFNASTGVIFKEEYIRYMDEEPEEGFWYISVDPAGFASMENTTQGKLTKLDESAISIVKVGDYGWYIDDIMHGRWGIRETATRILRAAQKYKALVVGIESGTMKNAIMPYISDEMMRLKVFPRIEGVTHGNKKKTDRITWALQGRFEHGRIWFKEDADYVRPLTEQLMDFPNPLARDDMIDSLAYIDQISNTDYAYMDKFDEEDNAGTESFNFRGVDRRTGY